jgi:hypothetical protein
MSVYLAFWLGFGGSVSVEVIAACRYYYPPAAPFPKRYKHLGFYLLRFFVALIAGGLAASYQVQNPVVAIHIGASAPLIIGAFGQKPRPHRVPPSACGPCDE